MARIPHSITDSQRAPLLVAGNFMMFGICKAHREVIACKRIRAVVAA
jgi:hypothetical protein